MFLKFFKIINKNNNNNNKKIEREENIEFWVHAVLEHSDRQLVWLMNKGREQLLF
jgi:hypothetical protein